MGLEQRVCIVHCYGKHLSGLPISSSSVADYVALNDHIQLLHLRQQRFEGPDRYLVVAVHANPQCCSHLLGELACKAYILLRRASQYIASAQHVLAFAAQSSLLTEVYFPAHLVCCMSSPDHALLEVNQ